MCGLFRRRNDSYHDALPRANCKGCLLTCAHALNSWRGSFPAQTHGVSSVADHTLAIGLGVGIGLGVLLLLAATLLAVLLLRRRKRATKPAILPVVALVSPRIRQV